MPPIVCGVASGVYLIKLIFFAVDGNARGFVSGILTYRTLTCALRHRKRVAGLGILHM